MKKLLALVLALAMALSLVACGNDANTPADDGAGDGSQPAATNEDDGTTPAATGETVSLTLWGAEEDQELLAELVEGFKAKYSGTTFDIQIGVESESTAKDTILTDIEAAADVYAFASDQLPDLVAAGAILALEGDIDTMLQAQAEKSVEDIKAANSEGSVEAATYDDTLYAFPFSSDGFFLFYDPEYVTAEQADSWDTLLEAAAAAGKQVGMTFASGWYNAGFFYGAGFTTALNEDGTTSIDWNGTSPDGITGVDVVESMLEIAGNSAFYAVDSDSTSGAISSGKLCAIVSGCWDSGAVAEAFGDDYAACKMPTFTVNDEQVRMKAVASYKLMGVNPHAENTGWAVLLAEYLSNEESQVARYEQRALPPTNTVAASDPAVAADKGVAGLADQSEYAIVQSVGNNYWDPTKSFGAQIAQGTLKVGDEAGIQQALDDLVAGVTAPIN